MTVPAELTAVYAAGIEPRHVSALVQSALKARAWYGLDRREADVHMADVESDGRRAKRTARALIDAGLVRETLHKDDSSIHQRMRYFVQIEAALKLVEAEKPNLRAAVNDWNRSAILEGRAPIGVAFDQLTLQQQKWVTLYPHEYRWQWIGLHQEIAWHPGNSLPDNHWRMKLHVSDAALREEFETEIRNRKIDALMAHNASWAIEKLANVDADAVKTFMTIGDLGFGRGETHFSGDPATWAETAKILTDRAQAKLATALKQVEAAVKVAAAVAQHGGWDKLGADLRIKVEAKIDAKGTNDEEGSDAP